MGRFVIIAKHEARPCYEELDATDNLTEAMQWFGDYQAGLGIGWTVHVVERRDLKNWLKPFTAPVPRSTPICS